MFDFVLPGEQVLSHEVVTNEPLASVLVEIASY
ncbi:competence regulator inhibitor paratox [Streptococcus suis]